MTSVAVAVTIIFCLFIGALVGMRLRTIIPQEHLDSDTRDLIKLGVGLIGTMSALVLGLLVASTKGAYDTEKSELAQIAGNVILLDRVLAHYGIDADSGHAIAQCARRTRKWIAALIAAVH